MRTFLLSMLIVIGLGACSTQILRVEFDQDLDRYNHLVRWHELDNASLFISEPFLRQYHARASAAKDIRIVDCRIVRTNYDAERRMASVDVEIDYYRLSSNRLKTVRDRQEWAYVEEKGSKKWRVVSLFPEFK